MPTILLIDDSTTVRRQLRRLLEPHGYTVLEAENGKIGVQLATDRAPDLLIVDIHMPVMNGLDAVAQIRALPAHADTPIFMLTTETSARIAARGKELGATAWMVKPCDEGVLLRGIQTILGRAGVAQAHG